jgi:hypothetical protein
MPEGAENSERTTPESKEALQEKRPQTQAPPTRPTRQPAKGSDPPGEDEQSESHKATTLVQQPTAPWGVRGARPPGRHKATGKVQSTEQSRGCRVAVKPGGRSTATRRRRTEGGGVRR